MSTSATSRPAAAKTMGPRRDATSVDASNTATASNSHVDSPRRVFGPPNCNGRCPGSRWLTP